ncbi:MAG TPA: potassium-transporting ATPase subunit C, partial [Variovorax sp.]
MAKFFRPLLAVFVLLSAITGIVYPLAVAGVAKVVFPAQASGSLAMRNGEVIGSQLIGQN